MPDEQPTDDNVRAAYEEVCRSHHAIDDFRATLLKLLPLASVGGLFLLLQGQANFDKRFLSPGGIFGFVVTVGLYIYELRGIQQCMRLLKVGQELERKLKVKGHFRRMPQSIGHIINELAAAVIIYSAVLAGWAFVAVVPFLPKQVPDGNPVISKMCAAVLVGIVFLTGVVSALGFSRCISEDWFKAEVEGNSC